MSCGGTKYIIDNVLKIPLRRGDWNDKVVPVMSAIEDIYNA